MGLDWELCKIYMTKLGLWPKYKYPLSLDSLEMHFLPKKSEEEKSV